MAPCRKEWPLYVLASAIPAPCKQLQSSWTKTALVRGYNLPALSHNMNAGTLQLMRWKWKTTQIAPRPCPPAQVCAKIERVHRMRYNVWNPGKEKEGETKGTQNHKIIVAGEVTSVQYIMHYIMQWHITVSLISREVDWWWRWQRWQELSELKLYKLTAIKHKSIINY